MLNCAVRFGLLLICSFVFLVADATASNWPRFRGPNGTGVSTDKDVPVEFGPEKNVVWKVALPGAGHSSPIVFNQRIFLQTATADARERIMLCLDLKDGKTVWQKSLPGNTAVKHQFSSFASPTAATDGKRVFMPFWDGKNLLFLAFDYNTGEILWKRDLGPFTSQHGLGHSPIIFEGKVILSNDQDGSSALIALDAENGSTAWQVDRPFNRASYSTPALLEKQDGTAEILVTTGPGFAAYDPKTGAENWDWEWTNHKLRTVGSPVFTSNMIFVGSGDGGGARHAVGVNFVRKGTATETSLAWEEKKSFPYVPTMLTKGEHLYSVNDRGVAACHVAKTGKVVWEERLGGAVFASPIMVDGKIYVGNDAGDVYVYPAEPKFNLLATNSLGETIMASPAVGDSRLLIRGANHLFCFGKTGK